MSRVDDDREAARQTERLLAEKLRQEQKVQEMKGQQSAFSKLVERKDAEQVVFATDAEATEVEELAEGHEATVEESVEASESLREQARQSADKQRGRGGLSEAGAKARGARASEAEREHLGHLGDSSASARAGQGRSADQRAGADTAQGRRSDAREVQRALRQSEKPVGAMPASGEKADKGARTDADGGGGQGGQRDSKGGGEGAAFRFNPALMAPVPVAQPKASSNSDRLRQLASEIAQKIVDRVRVGKNAEGKAEFQIDLHSSVLAGLSIKVSGSGGRIKAVFSGSDREVLKLLREQASALKGALSSRGLTLEELRIEERA